MTSKRWQTLKQIFNKALDLHGSKRKAFIEEACGDDSKLRDEVESLLDAYNTPGALDNPPHQLMESVLSHHAAGEKRVNKWAPIKSSSC